MEIFGSWPNATQGIVGAILGGLIAVVIAMLTVTLTSRAEKQRSLFDSAREQVGNLMRFLTSALVDIPDSGRSIRADIELVARIATEILVTASYVSKIDEDLANMLIHKREEFNTLAECWRNTPLDAASSQRASIERYNEIESKVRDLPPFLASFLANGAIELTD